MSLIDLDELQTVQEYIQTLFDSMPSVDVHQHEDLQRNLIEQNVVYGRKIIELSDKFTAKYRKDNFLNRKDIEDKIAHIHRIVCPLNYSTNMQEMVGQILKALGEERTSYAGDVQSRTSNVLGSRGSVNPLHNYGTKDSKLDYYRDEADLMELKYQHNSSQPRRDKNLTKSKVSYENQQVIHKRKRSVASSNAKATRLTTGSKKNHVNNQDFSTKNVLELKNKFQEEVQSIKQIFEQMNTLVRSSGLKISQQNSNFTKEVSDQDKENLKDFALANIENNLKNLKKLSQLVELVQEHFQKKIKMEGFAQGKFKIYTDQINKREQVFSFAVSKMLQHLGDLRENVVQKINSTESLNLIDSLETIGNQFYELFPSHSIIKDLKVEKLDKELQKIGFKSYGCQISIGKSQKTIHREMAQSKRNLLELYKVSTRVNETIQRFEKSIKFKKQVDQKEVQKFVESIRESFPRKNSNQIPASVTNQVISYQEDLKKILDQSQRTEKELNDQFNKKTKKNDKKICELQKAIDDLILELKKQQDNHENSKKKLTKKIQTEKQQNKTLNGIKKQLQKQIKQLSKQINRLQDQIKDQYRKCDDIQRNLLRENNDHKVQLSKKQQIIQKLENNQKQQLTKWEEEREIYHQKIILLETHEQTNAEEMSQLKVELQEMIKQNQTTKKHILELTDVYQINVKQQEEMVASLNKLQKSEKQKKVEIKDLKDRLKIADEINKNIQKDKQKCLEQIQKWEKCFKEKEEQAEKYKQMGVLNDSDIEILKQQMDKVKEAYLQSQEQLENSRAYLSDLQNQKQYLIREVKKLKRDIDEANSRWQNNTLNKQRMEKDIRQFHDELTLKNKQYSHLTQETDDLKRQVFKLRKENQQLRENYTKCEDELRATRQDQQKRFQNDSLEAGKRKLELQATKVELRRKNQQLQKIKETCDEKIQVLESKNKELSQFITQKQMLARINNSHMST